MSHCNDKHPTCTAQSGNYTGMVIMDERCMAHAAPGPIRYIAPVSSNMRNTYLVTYDIRDDKRLRKVYKTMRNFGDHLQYSVFECQFTPIDLAKCQHELGEIINHAHDQVLFIDLGPTEGRGERVITALGQPYTPINSPCIVV